MRLRIALALSLLAARSQPDIDVALRDGRVVVRTVGAPLAEVLSRFAQATGAEVVYETARPRQLVSVVIEAASPAEAIAQLLEGQGLNYALRLDPDAAGTSRCWSSPGSASPAAAPAGTTRASARAPRRRPRGGVRGPAEDVERAARPDAAEGPDPARAAPERPRRTRWARPSRSPSRGRLPAAAPGVEAVEPGDVRPVSVAPEPGQPQPPAAASYPGAPRSALRSRRRPSTPAPPPTPAEIDARRASGAARRGPGETPRCPGATRTRCRWRQQQPGHGPGDEPQPSPEGQPARRREGPRGARGASPPRAGGRSRAGPGASCARAAPERRPIVAPPTCTTARLGARDARASRRPAPSGRSRGPGRRSGSACRGVPPRPRSRRRIAMAAPVTQSSRPAALGAHGPQTAVTGDRVERGGEPGGEEEEPEQGRRGAPAPLRAAVRVEEAGRRDAEPGVGREGLDEAWQRVVARPRCRCSAAGGRRRARHEGRRWRTR